MAVYELQIFISSSLNRMGLGATLFLILYIGWSGVDACVLVSTGFHLSPSGVGWQRVCCEGLSVSVLPSPTLSG